MKHFLNPIFDARDVLRVKVDLGILNEFKPLLITPKNPNDYITVNPHWDSDMRWISPNTIETFKLYLDLFKRLNISRHVVPFLDLHREVRMYSGFLVKRSICEKPNFHTDWIKTNNEAFTLITPLTDNTDGFGLLYKKTDGTLAEHNYKLGEALIFGDNFLHSTKPGRSTDDSPTVFLSYTFGTDKMKHWANISRTAGYQGNLIRLPDGRFLVKDIDKE